MGSVDKSAPRTFRTSKDLSFVRRMRSLPGATPPSSRTSSRVKSSYRATIDDVSFVDGKASTILTRKGFPQLILDIVIHEDGIVRFTVDEFEPIKERFRVKDVVIESNFIFSTEVKSDSLAKRDEDIVLEITETHRLVLVSYPFRVEIFNGEELIFQLNSRDLLRVEPLHRKAEAQRLFCGCFPCGKKPPPKGDWEEVWAEEVDSKPDGPSAVSLDVTFSSCEGLFGLPERACASKLADTAAGEPYRLYNVDDFGYPLDDPKGLYGSVPMVFARGTKQSLALFWHNASDTFVDVMSEVKDGSVGATGDKNVHFISETGVADLFIMLGPTVEKVYHQYATLTGFPAMPPLFSLGLHQSRWNYFSEDEVVEVDFGYDVINVPLDVIWLDIEYTKDKRYLEWDENKFPDPARLHARLASRGRKLVTIVDPHLKCDDDFILFTEAKDQKFLIDDAEGSYLKGKCWPGESAWVDFTNPEARSWWRRVVADRLHSTNMWIDMNEPSAFSAPEKTLPKDALHAGGVEHRNLHNLYGFYMQMASYDALKARGSDGERPFLLSRSFYAGSQRFGAVWTGDNIADWSHLKMSISMVLSLNLCGVPFCGADVGGFTRDPSPELFLRWIQLGAFFPFFRIHSQKDTAPREIFKQEASLIPLFKAAIDLRYSLLPHWYTVFYASSRSGMPVIRPLWMHFSNCPAVDDNETTFTIGDSILVAPVIEEGQKEISILLPAVDDDDCWFGLNAPHSRFPANNDAPLLFDNLALSDIPAFIRSGRIVATLDTVEGIVSSEALRHSSLKLIVALNARQEAKGALFQDDRVSFRYVEEKAFVFRSLRMSDNVLKSVDAADNENAKYHSRILVESVVILGVAKAPMGALVTMTTVREQTSRSDTPEEREGNVIHSRSTVAVMTRKFTTQKTVPLIYDKDAKSVVIKGLSVEASFDWDIKLL